MCGSDWPGVSLPLKFIPTHVALCSSMMISNRLTPVPMSRNPFTRLHLSAHRIVNLAYLADVTLSTPMALPSA